MHFRLALKIDASLNCLIMVGKPKVHKSVKNSENVTSTGSVTGAIDSVTGKVSGQVSGMGNIEIN